MPESGSIILAENQVIGERIPLVGVPFDLYYYSSRVVGRTEEYTLHIPITPASPTSDLARVDLKIEIAGRTIMDSVFPTPPATIFAPGIDYNFTWDGLDSASQAVIGSRKAKVTITEHYDPPKLNAVGRVSQYEVGGWRAKSLGLGGWVPSILHFYDVGGKVLEYGYGGTREVTASAIGTEHRIESDDNSEVFMFDASGRHDRTLYALTGEVKYQFNYDLSGQLVSVVDAFSKTTAITYVMGAATKVTGPYGKETLLRLDGNGWLDRVTLPNGTDKFDISYHGSGGLMAKFTNPEGHASAFTYDLFGRLVRDDGPNSSYKTLTRTRLNSTQDKISIDTALGRRNEYTVTYGPNKFFPVAAVYATSTTSNFTQYTGGSTSYYRAGATLQLPRSNDIRFGTGGSFRYAINRTFGSSSLNTNVSQAVSYSGAAPFGVNEFKETYTTNGKAFSVTYAGSPRKVTYKTPLLRTAVVDITSRQLPTQYQWADLTPISYAYDGDGRVIQALRGARSTGFAYNVEGEMVSMEDSLGRVTSFTYDDHGRMLTQTLPDSRVISFSYDKNGNLTSVMPPSRPAHTMAYNADGNMSEYVPPALGGPLTATTYSYNTDKQLTGVVRPDGQTVALAYGLTTGRLSSITTPGGTYSYSWDNGRDALSSVQSPDGITTTISYPFNNNPLLNAAAQNGAAAGGFSISRNADLRVSQETLQNSAGANVSTWSLAYDNDGLLTSFGPLTLNRHPTRGYVSSLEHGNVTETLSYNSFGEVTGQDVDDTIGPTALYNVTYVRDVLGRVMEKSETVGGAMIVYAYAYDNTGRLASVERNGSAYSSYTYDANGNRDSSTVSGVTVTAMVDAQDRLIAHGALSYTYGLNGELASKKNSGSSPTETTTYSYDVMGNLKSVTLPNGDVITYVIDGFNRRVVRKVNGTAIRRWIYRDQLRLIGELDGSGNFRSHFLYGSKSHVPEAMVTSGGVEYRIITDQIGSVRLVVKASDGTIAQRIDYDEFGRVLSDTNPGFQPFGFAGGLYDPDTKLVRFGARDYDPEVGRFTSKDPILFEGRQTNLYGYSFSDPINFIDPDGQTAIAPGIGAGAGIGTIVMPGPGTVVGGIIGGVIGGWLTWEGYNYFANRPKPPLTGPPDGSISIPDGKGGKHQERCYDDKGNPSKDFDWGHDHTGAGRPHVHDWTPNPSGGWQRGPPRTPRPGEIK